MKRFMTAGLVIGGALFLAWGAGFLLFIDKVFSYPDGLEAQSAFRSNEDNEAALRTGIAVLTGGRNRIAKGFELLLLKKGAKLFISGVKPGVSLEEIALNDGIELNEAIDAELGFEATDTVGNAKEIKAWAETNGFFKIIGVTSFYHIPRSRLELWHAMGDKEIVFAAVGSEFVRRDWWRHFSSFKFLAVEYTKFLAVFIQYKILGRLF